MKNILLDTNIYGLALERKEIANIMIYFAEEKLRADKKYFISGFKVINDEINAVPHRETRTRLIELYNAVISGEIKISDSIKSLALDYFNECKKERARITLEDCQIVAAGCVANVKYIVTDNRKTMRSPRSMDIFNSINKRKNLRTPEFMGYEQLKSFLLSSGVS